MNFTETRYRFLSFRRGYTFALSLAGWLGAANAGQANNILILQSHDSAPYREAVAGFQAALAANQLLADCRVQTLADAQAAIDSQTAGLVFTLGTPATRSALAQISSTPVVGGLLLDVDSLLNQANATGVGLNFSAELQWEWLRRMLPNIENVAVIYHPQQGANLFQSLSRLARNDGVTLFAVPAATAEDFPPLLQSLPNQVDALWATDSAVAYNASTVRELLLYSFRNRIPLIGLSAQWVKAGALYALDWDYRDLGAQAAELAVAILAKQQQPGNLPPEGPRKVRPVLNLKTLDYMKLQVPERWLPDMAEVYR